MTITTSQTVQPNQPSHRPRIARRAISATTIADTHIETPDQPKPSTRSLAKATEQRSGALPKGNVPKARNPGAQPSPPTKQSLLIALLERKRGATIDELMHATGWQAHSVRGVLSGVLRKRLGLNVHAELLDGIRHYRVTTKA